MKAEAEKSECFSEYAFEIHPLKPVEKKGCVREFRLFICHCVCVLGGRRGRVEEDAVDGAGHYERHLP